MRVSLFSGGKESFYSSMLCGPADLYLVLVYEFPEPSPHLVNLGLVVETGLLSGKPVVVKKLRRGSEFRDSVELLTSLGAKTIIAGDVSIDEHLRYMERLAGEAGAELKEPLWGMDPEELLAREVESGLEFVIIGAVDKFAEYLGVKVTLSNHREIIKASRERGIDPVGERGEYHTLVVNSPAHAKQLEYEVLGELKSSKSSMLRLASRGNP